MMTFISSIAKSAVSAPCYAVVIGFNPQSASISKGITAFAKDIGAMLLLAQKHLVVHFFSLFAVDYLSLSETYIHLHY